MTEQVAVIGLGRMGNALAVRLSSQNMPVTGWTRSGADPRAQAGGYRAAGSLADAASADILILSLFDDAAVREMLGRLADLDLSGRLVVETSTVSPAVVRDMAPAIEAAGGRLIDAPISGGPEMVAAGTIGFYVGGADQDIKRFLPVAEMLSNRIVAVGALGAGAAAKIVNNVGLAGAFQAMIEAIRLGAAMGLPLDTMLAFLKDSPAANPMFRARIAKITGADKDVGFPIDAILKDSDLFVEVAESFGHDLKGIRGFQPVLRSASESGLGAKDGAELVNFVLSEAWANRQRDLLG